MDQNTSMTDAANTILRISGGVENPGAIQGPTQVVPGSIRNIQLLHPSGAATSSNRLPGMIVLLAQTPPAFAQIPVNKILAPLLPAPATSMQARKGDSRQTDLAVTGHLRGEGASGAGRGEPKPKGEHWREMVQKGTFPKLHQEVTKWAKFRKDKEADFTQHFDEKGVHEPIPWKVETKKDTGNKLKVLYMYLIMLSYEGTVELVRGPITEGLYGILKFIVKKDKRAKFDAGAFPSISSSGIFGEPRNKDPKYKEMFRLWQTAGFVESLQVGSGDLEFEYKADLKQKVKDQVNETRQRQKERSGTMQADV
jgi:hypothetical protein